jgi:hypothetical protein
MFVESKEKSKEGVAAWLEGRAREHPGAFTAVLLLLAIGITTGLLFKTGYTLILYQGF